MSETIGILALQGDFLEHEMKLKSINPELSIVRVTDVNQLKELDRLILPGGESTTMNLLANHGSENTKLFGELKKRIQKGDLPVLATCAGLILLANEIFSFPSNNSLNPILDVLPVRVLRNHYGRQQNSFETQLKINGFSSEFQGVFIRAPVIEKMDGNNEIEVLSEFQNSPVLIKYKNVIASTFHPELVKDTRIHELFLSLKN